MVQSTHNESKEMVSFYERTSELNSLTAEHLLGISPPMNATMESVETVIDIL